MFEGEYLVRGEMTERERRPISLSLSLSLGAQVAPVSIDTPRHRLPPRHFLTLLTPPTLRHSSAAKEGRTRPPAAGRRHPLSGRSVHALFRIFRSRIGTGCRHLHAPRTVGQRPPRRQGAVKMYSGANQSKGS